MNSVYIGGATSIANAQVGIDLAGSLMQWMPPAWDSRTHRSAAAAPNSPANVRLDAPGRLSCIAANHTESFAFNLISNGAATTLTATVTGAVGGISEGNVLTQLNTQLNSYGITAQVGTDGQLQFAGATPFTVNTSLANATTDKIATSGATASNLGTYNVQGADNYAGGLAEGVAENLTIQNGQQSYTVALDGTETLGGAIAKINAQTGGAASTQWRMRPVPEYPSKAPITSPFQPIPRTASSAPRQELRP